MLRRHFLTLVQGLEGMGDRRDVVAICIMVFFYKMC